MTLSPANPGTANFRKRTRRLCRSATPKAVPLLGAAAARPERASEVFRLYDGMNNRLDEVCADYDQAQLATITDFLTRAREVGALATEEFATPK